MLDLGIFLICIFIESRFMDEDKGVASPVPFLYNHINIFTYITSFTNNNQIIKIIIKY